MTGRLKEIEQENHQTEHDAEAQLRYLTLWFESDESQLRVLRDYGCVCGAGVGHTPVQAGRFYAL